MRNVKLRVRRVEHIARAGCGVLMVLMIAFIPSPLWGEGKVGGPSTDILKRVQSTYRDVNDLTADFVQQSYIEGFDAKSFRGTLFLKKPGMVRWDYTRPVKQNIVINGDKIILYFHEQKQAIIQKASAHPDAEPAMGLLSNIEKWEESFSVKGEDPSGDFFMLKLTPKTMTMVKEVIVEVDKETYYIKKLILFENSGNRVSFSFSGITFNSGIKGSLFDFKIPGGTEVLKY